MTEELQLHQLVEEGGNGGGKEGDILEKLYKHTWSSMMLCPRARKSAGEERGRGRAGRGEMRESTCSKSK